MAQLTRDPGAFTVLRTRGAPDDNMTSTANKGRNVKDVKPRSRASSITSYQPYYGLGGSRAGNGRIFPPRTPGKAQLELMESVSNLAYALCAMAGEVADEASM